MLNSKTGTLQAQAPFDFARTLAFLGMFPPMQGEQTLAERSVTKAVSVDGQAVAFRLQAEGTLALAYTLYAEQPISDSLERAAADRIAFFLSLSDDLRLFYALGEEDEAFAPLIHQFYGLHHVKFQTPFESACWAILSQRTPMAVAQGIKHRIGASLGVAIEVDGVTYHAFPEPGQLLRLADEVAGVVGNARKVEYLLSAARAFDELDESWLRDAPSDEVEAWLLRIKGIGAWSARFVLIRGLGHMDRLSIGEGRMIDAVRKRYGNLSEAEIAAVGARYGDVRGYWAYYLRVAA